MLDSNVFLLGGRDQHLLNDRHSAHLSRLMVGASGWNVNRRWRRELGVQGCCHASPFFDYRRGCAIIAPTAAPGRAGRRATGDESGGTVVHGLIKRVRALTGVYGSGFASDSVMGVVLPFAVVALVGGLGALLVYLLN